MSEENKTLKKKLLVGSVIATVVLATAYYFASSKSSKPSKSGKQKIKPKQNQKENKITKNKGLSKITFNPSDVHFALVTEDKHDYCHVAADAKNKEIGLTYGSRLTHIDGELITSLSYKEVLLKLKQKNGRVTCTFEDFAEIEQQWTQADSFKNDANTAYKDSNIEKAIECCSKAIQLHPTNEVYYANRILMHLKKEDHDNAWKDCEKIQTLDPLSTYVKGHYLRGLLLFNKKQYQEAVNAFQTVIQLDPNCNEGKQAVTRLDQCKVQLKKEEVSATQTFVTNETASKKNQQ